MARLAHFELFEHTADLGVRVWAPTRAALIAPATEGLYAAIGEVVAGGAAAPWSVNLAGDEPALLLRDYLAEVLHLFDGARRRLARVEVQQFTDECLSVLGDACPVDMGRSVLVREIKAITYHELALRRVADGYEATWIVDI
jgi:SHS2 domain-containing protein